MTADGDVDNDGLSNEHEIGLGTDPLNPDTDGDGIYDGTEYGLTTPESADTDLSAGFFVPDADPTTTTNRPNTLKIRPRVSFPTGTIKDDDLMQAFMPRSKPCTDVNATVRTSLRFK